MNGSVYKRCPCTETSGGKQQKKKACKKSHGSWFYTHDVPTFGGEREPRIKQGGFPTKEAAATAGQGEAGKEGTGCSGRRG
jgi:hypothetical protein